jgi:hypothetical protein
LKLLNEGIAMESTTIKTVDFIPQYDILGDIKKVSELDFSIQNAKIVPIVTILCMERGSNVLVPDMGLKEIIRSLPYNDIKDVYSILESINAHLTHYTGFQNRVYIDETDPKTDYKKGELVIRIDIEGVVDPLKVNVNKANTIFVRHPSLFMGK